MIDALRIKNDASNMLTIELKDTDAFNITSEFPIYQSMGFISNCQLI